MLERLENALGENASDPSQAIAAVEHFLGEVQLASTRLGALSVRAEAYGEIMRTRLETIDSWIDGAAETTRGAGQLPADVPEFDELVESPHEAERRAGRGPSREDRARRPAPG